MKEMRGPWRIVCAAMLVAVAAGCRTGINYSDPSAPRYAGGSARPTVADGELHIVSFNIAYGEKVEKAIEALTTEPDLAGAGIVLLQEMDAAGTARIASALGLQYRYYPAVASRRTNRDFGNAVLSKWPIVADEKIILPYTGILARTQRIATAVTVTIGDRRVRVYSAHLGTIFELNDAQRARQVETIVADAERYDAVIIGGDFNDGRAPRAALAHGYTWVTRDGPRTHFWGHFDHILTRGLRVPDDASGAVDDTGVSDHKPIWALAGLPPGGTRSGTAPSPVRDR